MLAPWLHQRTRESGEIPLSCLLCVAASRAAPTSLIDPATALALSAEETFSGRTPPKVAEEVVSRLLALSEAEAREILAAVPETIREDCGPGRECDFHQMAVSFLSAPRVVW